MILFCPLSEIIEKQSSVREIFCQFLHVVGYTHDLDDLISSQARGCNVGWDGGYGPLGPTAILMDPYHR